MEKNQICIICDYLVVLSMHMFQRLVEGRSLSIDQELTKVFLWGMTPQSPGGFTTWNGDVLTSVMTSHSWKQRLRILVWSCEVTAGYGKSGSCKVAGPRDG